MANLIAKVRRFLVREDGPTAVEYAVMLGMIILVCIAVVIKLGGIVNGFFTSTNSSSFGAGS